MLRILCFLTIFLSACGPTLNKKKNDSDLTIKKIVVFPLNIQAEISKDDEKFFENLIISRLKEKGYVVLDPYLISSVCKTQENCEANRDKLNQIFTPDAFVKTTINSSFALNVLAGHYNTLDGELIFESTSGDPIYSIDYNESERGGLIFNSGQVLQGLIESYNEFGNSPFKRLSQKFTESIFSVLPRANMVVGSSPIQSPKFDYIISATNFESYSRICVASNQRGKAELLSDGFELNLREISNFPNNKRPLPNLDNLYCANLPLKDIAAVSKNKPIELRFTSYFGGANYKDITTALNSF